MALVQTARFLTSAIAATVTLFGPARLLAGEPIAGRVVLHVVDYAEVPAPTLHRAQEVATRVYAEAGVQAVWAVGQHTSSEEADGAVHLTVMILPREMTEQKCASEGLGGSVFGRAARATRRAHIFYDRIVELSARKGQDRRILLGKVLAHEVGHLVLPESPHSGSGIMSSNLDFRRSRQSFTKAQGKTIRAVLAPFLSLRS